MSTSALTSTVVEPAEATAEGADGADGAAPPRFRVRGLTVGFPRDGVADDVVKDVSFELRAGQCVAIVGESGSGKSVTARTLVGLPGRGAVVRADELSFDGDDVLAFGARRWREVRGRRIGVVLQDALVSLDPLRPVGREIAEALRLHGWGDRRSRRARVVELLATVGVPAPGERARQRPDQLSGGLRQRALIASAIALDPEVVIADEPTTALDVSVQAQVLAELERMKARGVAVILISHDLSVVAHLADHILVMRDGVVVESGPASVLLRHPHHAYTRRLIAAVPSARTRGRRLAPDTEPADRAPESRPAHSGPVLEVRDVSKTFRLPGGGQLRAVDGVSFDLERGTTIGIVGESGSGKTTTGRIALALEQPDSGEVRLLGQPWSNLRETSRRPLRRRMAVVYQDPLSSFDPRWTTDRILRDALDPATTHQHARVRELLGQVGLDESVLGRFPLHMSGGQRQRIAIARALASSPDVIVLDEAVSALDVSIQAQILDLLVDLQQQLGVSYLLISHDLGVISHMSDHVLVMKDGAVVERGPADQIFERPRHAYTQQLVSALPTVG
jgi:peptide/nickel transport system ATP-binding protein